MKDGSVNDEVPKGVLGLVPIARGSLVDRECASCDKRIPPGSRTDKMYCSDTCRQRAHRERQRAA